jgi:hypothetical protein
LATVGATVAVAGSALATSSYTTGTYKAGNPKTGAGLRMTIRNGAFSVQVIRFHETCSYGSHTGVDYFAFVQGSRAALTGQIDGSGNLSGAYHASGGTVSISGRVSGGTATVTGREHGPYNPASTVHPNSCHGSHTFRATVSAG